MVLVLLFLFLVSSSRLKEQLSRFSLPILLPNRRSVVVVVVV